MCMLVVCVVCKLQVSYDCCNSDYTIRVVFFRCIISLVDGDISCSSIFPTLGDIDLGEVILQFPPHVVSGEEFVPLQDQDRIYSCELDCPDGFVDHLCNSKGGGVTNQSRVVYLGLPNKFSIDSFMFHPNPYESLFSVFYIGVICPYVVMRCLRIALGLSTIL